MQRQVAVCLLLVCTVVNCASVGVVRVPRIYNVLIRSDGALAPSEAVSADSPHDQPSQDKSRAPNDDSQDDYGEETRDEEDGEDEEEKEDPLPVLDPKNGAIQDNVNYTAVPLSRAYPLTRYTAPIIAAHYPISYLSPLHGGLILGPVPRLPTPIQHQQQQYQDQAPREERTELGVPSLQSMYQAQQQQQQQRQESRSISSLPNGAFEDYDRDSVAVEAGEEQN